MVLDSSVLGPDGKLTAAERKRRQDNNLCFRCGGAHRVKDCPGAVPQRLRGNAGEMENASDLISEAGGVTIPTTQGNA
jgi:hypothetical protein